jgi:hypothetical protein
MEMDELEAEHVDYGPRPLTKNLGPSQSSSKGIFRI